MTAFAPCANCTDLPCMRLCVDCLRAYNTSRREIRKAADMATGTAAAAMHWVARHVVSSPGTKLPAVDAYSAWSDYAKDSGLRTYDRMGRNTLYTLVASAGHTKRRAAEGVVFVDAAIKL